MLGEINTGTLRREWTIYLQVSDWSTVFGIQGLARKAFTKDVLKLDKSDNWKSIVDNFCGDEEQEQENNLYMWNHVYLELYSKCKKYQIQVTNSLLFLSP